MREAGSTIAAGTTFVETVALIASELTEKQWTAVTAELHGMPLPQIAEKLGTNTNSIYKLLHDARKKLRSGLEAEGFTIDELREAWA